MRPGSSDERALKHHSRWNGKKYGNLDGVRGNMVAKNSIKGKRVRQTETGVRKCSDLGKLTLGSVMDGDGNGGEREVTVWKGQSLY